MMWILIAVYLFVTHYIAYLIGEDSGKGWGIERLRELQARLDFVQTEALKNVKIKTPGVGVKRKK